jgi:hypothetical protein
MKRFEQIKKDNGTKYSDDFSTVVRGTGFYKNCRIGFFTKPVTVFKKARSAKNLNVERIVELEIPAGTLVRTGVDFHAKQRCAAAKVKAIYNLVGKKIKDVAVADWDSEYKQCRFYYKVDSVVNPRYSFDIQPQIECGSGIHFFFSYDKAKDYHI